VIFFLGVLVDIENYITYILDNKVVSYSKFNRLKKILIFINK
jgi:hypothetical protein